MKHKIPLLTQKKNLYSDLEDTFTKNKILSGADRIDGIKILKHLFQKRVLPVKVYRNPNKFKISDFKKKKNEIWGVTIKYQDGESIDTDHIFSRKFKKIKKFIKEKMGPKKICIIRLSPPKEKIEYYGAYLLDKKNFHNKVIITISNRPENNLIMKNRKYGQSFKILPRDFVPDFKLEYNGRIMKGKFNKNYMDTLKKDINKMRKFIKKTKRENLTIPILFIIYEKKILYVSLGI